MRGGRFSLPLPPSTDSCPFYRLAPLASLSGPARGAVLEKVARRLVEETQGVATTDATGGGCFNGKKRSRYQGEFDFAVGGRRFEVKSAKLTPHQNGRPNVWGAEWSEVKPLLHDVLLLVLYTPLGIYVFEHDGHFGVCRKGRKHALGGVSIKVYGGKHESAEGGVRCVHEKLGSMFRAHLSFPELLSKYGDLLSTTTTHDAYVDTPLNLLSCSDRGLVLEDLVRRVVSSRTGVDTHDAEATSLCVNGTRRSRQCADYDFLFSGRRIEVKSAQVRFLEIRQQWCAHWSKINPGCHDTLILVLYTPFGIGIYEHDGQLGFGASRGKPRRRRKGVRVLGPSRETGIHEAVRVIRGKMRSMLIDFLHFHDHPPPPVT